jgi:putative ABC transport system substrate-binding protein
MTTPGRQRHAVPLARRTVLTGALAVLAAPAMARAQAPARVHRIGLLAGSSPTSPESRHVWQAFLEELRNLGYVQGQNLVIEERFYGDRLEQVQPFADELVRLRVDLIVAGAIPAPEAARRATATIPIVMANHSDPVAGGLVASFARPGGNVTGLSMSSPEMRIKQLQLFKEVLPSLTRVAFLRHATIPLDMGELQDAARSLGLQAQVVEARTPDDLATAVAGAAREGAGALFVLTGSMFFAHREQLAKLAARHRLPDVYLLKEHVDAGGFMAYGVDLRDNFRRLAGYVDRILKGARPGDLPIEQPTKFVLALNRKTARALGLTIPPAILARADHIVG